MAKTKQDHVLIVGAGTTGLLIAQGLKKYGIDFTIFEGESQDNYLNHQRDWSMALLWGADYIKNTLPDHLRERFDEIKTDKFYVPEAGHEETLPFYNGKTGELVVRLPGGLATRVSRLKLRTLFAEDLEIQFNKRVENVKEDGENVILTFTDGSSVTGSTVVFCDGVKSSAGRSLLLGEENAQLAVCNCSIVNITHKYPAEQARFIRGSLNPVFKFASHPDDSTLFLLTTTDIPDLEKPEDWIFQHLFTTYGATIAETPEERLRVFKKQASAYAEPWKSAVQWLPDDIVISRDRIKYWAAPTPWSTWNGKVTLAGDAAHPMVPFRAQGLNNAMRDSFGYVEAMRSIVSGESSLEAAIKVYTDEVFARGAQEIAMSNGFGPLLHNWEVFMNSPIMKLSYGKKPVAPVIQKEEAPSPDGKAVGTKNVPAVEATREVPVASKEPVALPVVIPTVIATDISKEAITLTPAASSKGAPLTLTTEVDSETDSTAPTVLPSPEPAADTFNTSVPSSDSTPLTNGEKPSWDALWAENEKLRTLNTDLVRKLLDVSRILGTGVQLDKAQTILNGDETVAL